MAILLMACFARCRENQFAPDQRLFSHKKIKKGMVTAVDKNHVLLTSWSRVGASEVSISVCPQSPHAISFPIPGYSTSRANGPHAPLTLVTVVFPEPHFAQVVVSDIA